MYLYLGYTFVSFIFVVVLFFWDRIPCSSWQTQTHHLEKDDFEGLILLPLLPKGWGYSHVAPCSALGHFFLLRIFDCCCQVTLPYWVQLSLKKNYLIYLELSAHSYLHMLIRSKYLFCILYISTFENIPAAYYVDENNTYWMRSFRLQYWENACFTLTMAYKWTSLEPENGIVLPPRSSRN